LDFDARCHVPLAVPHVVIAARAVLSSSDWPNRGAEKFDAARGGGGHNAALVKLEPRNILVLDFGQLGDVVLSLPALAAIRRHFPLARITVAGGSAAALVMEMSGSADRTLAIDRVSLRDGPKLDSLKRLAKLVADVRRSRYDLAIDLHSLSESNLLAWLSGARERVFAQRGGRSLDLLATMRAPGEDREKHQVDRYLDVLVPLGIAGAPRIPRLSTRRADDEFVQGTFEERGVAADAKLVGLFPGASQPIRRWPLGRFAELASRLENDGARIVVFLGPEEAAVADQVRAAFSASTLVLDELTLSQVASAAARLRLLVSNDSGPMHLAAAVGTPVLLLLGAPVRGPYWFGPVGDDHRIIIRRTLADIGVAEVFAAARAMLRHTA
jgi:ADP-heptose:LPS heptosyltransferase